MKISGSSLPSHRLAAVVFGTLAVFTAAAPRSDAQPSGEDRLRHRWERLRYSEPPRRTAFTEGVGVYDPFHRQFIVHEGSASQVAALSVDDGRWRTAGLPFFGPGSRSSHTAVFDYQRRAMVIFGGTGGFEGRFNDVWSLDTRRRTWTRLDDAAAPHRPATRSNSTMVLDTNRDRLLVYGGITGVGLSPETLGDLFEFDLKSGTWREIVPVSGPTPTARLAHTAVFDRNRNRMLVYGGQYFGDGQARNLNDLWAFDCATETWTEIDAAGPAAPPALIEATLLIDDGHRAFLVGGSNGMLPTRFTKDVRVLDLRTDTWRLLPDLNDRGAQQPGGGPGGGPGQLPSAALKNLPPIAHHVAAYVPGDSHSMDPTLRRPRMFVFGGGIQKPDFSFEFRVDTWIYKRADRLFRR